MANLKYYQEKVEGISKTAKVTKAMESISAIKMRFAQKKAIIARYYSFYLFSVLKRVSKLFNKDLDNIFSQTCDVKGKTAIVLISSDKGLTGGANNFLFKKVFSLIKEKEIKKEDLSFICIGRKGKEFVERQDWKLRRYFHELGEKSLIDDINEVSEYVYDLYNTEEVKRVFVVYTNFKNTTTQTPEVRVVLPIVYKELRSFLKRILPTEGKYSHLDKIHIDDADVSNYLFEPSKKTFLKELTPLILRIMIYYAMLESYASEHSARMVAMKNATDQALNLSDRFRRKFNKERQAIITREISEIVSGMEAMK